tara:strand:- start:166 stop:1359 length:1194 start_codon:yes stop_codon:yes gene_type:complete
MAVDTTLIQGAYEVNKPQELVGVKAISDVTQSLAGGLKSYMDGQIMKHTVRNAEWDLLSESVMSNSDLVGDQYEALYDDMQSGKAGFANADKKTRDLMKRDLVAMAGDYGDYKTLREDVAINIDDYSPAFTNSEEGQMYLDILKGDGKRLINNNGRIGIDVNGEWKSISSIKQELDANKIDKNSIDTLEAFRIKEQDSEKPFDRQKTRMTIMNSLVSKGSYNSLKNDEIIPGRIFRNDLAESLTNQTYGDLGITEQDLQDVEGVNTSDGIDAEEAENIILHLEGNKTEMKEVMADYYTSYIGNNISKSATGLSPSGDTESEYVTDADGNPVKNEKVWRNRQQTLRDQGYDIEVNGKWDNESQEAWERYNEGISDSERADRVRKEQVELGVPDVVEYE